MCGLLTPQSGLFATRQTKNLCVTVWQAVKLIISVL